MRIALDVSQIVYEGTGVGRYVYGLVKALLSLNSPHQFILYAGAYRRKKQLIKLSTQAPFSRATWKIFPLPPRAASLIFNHTAVPIDLFIGQHDLFHASDWTEPASRARQITTVHDLTFQLYPETVEPNVRETQDLRLRRIVNHQTHIIADSRSTKNDLMKIYHVPETRIDVVYPGIDPLFVRQSKQEIERVKNKYHLPSKFILSVGTQEPRKNLERLTEAAQAVNLPLVLVGRHGWGDRTQTLGFVPAPDLPALYSAATVFAFPSLYEGFGFPVLEAMAIGTPVVTSNVSSLPEVAGKAAVLVDPLDVGSIAKGIKQALANRTKLINAGYQQARKFTWDSCAKQVLEVYEKIARS